MRRLSTCITSTTFIITVFIIFQLYARRYHYQADSKYKPGAFLSGIQPYNSSYCNFNYGLPDILDWNRIKPVPSPQSVLRNYRVIYNVVTGTAYSKVSRYNSVTYATQATPEFIYHIVEIARIWEGPISLAVYTPDYDIDITMQLISHLCHCYPRMSKVSLHLFYPKRSPPKLVREPPPLIPEEINSNVTNAQLLQFKIEKQKKFNSKNRTDFIELIRKKEIKPKIRQMPGKGNAAPALNFEDCSGPDPSNILTYRREHSMVYPINVGRNVARYATKTDYFIVSDIEMLPSKRLASKFLKMVRKTIGNKNRNKGGVLANKVFVVPLFEVNQGEAVPRDKARLGQMVNENRAMYFHKTVCPHCQWFPGIDKWLNKSALDDVKSMLTTRREFPLHRWEPLYFGTQQVPWYSEFLSWDARQDKMTQMLEMCFRQFQFTILNTGFMVHFPRVYRFSVNNRKLTVKNNMHLYSVLTYYFKLRYKPSNDLYKRCLGLK